MRNLFTSFCLMVFVAIGISEAWAQQTGYLRVTDKSLLIGNDIQTAPQFVIRNGADPNYYLVGNGTTSIQALPNPETKGKFQFIRTTVADEYYIYNVDSKRYIATIDENPSGGYNKLTLVETPQENNIRHRWILVNDARAGFWDIVPASKKTDNSGTRPSWNITGGFSRKTLSFWEARDNNSVWEITEEVPLVEVTFNYSYENSVARTERKMLFSEKRTLAQQGVVVPTLYGVTGSTTTDLNVMPTANQIVEFVYVDKPEEKYPFTYYADYQPTKSFYTLQVKEKFAKYKGNGSTAAAFGLGTDVVLNDDYKFQFVGNPVSGFLVYNKQFGGNHALSVADKTRDDATFNLTGTPVRWHLKTRGGQWFFLLDGTENNYVNCRGGQNRPDELSTWNHPNAINDNQGGVAGDAGSRILFKDADAEKFWTGKLKEYSVKLDAMKGVTVFFTEQDVNEAKTQAGVPASVTSEEAYNNAKAQVDAAVGLLLPKAAGKQFKLKNKDRKSGTTSTHMSIALNGTLVHDHRGDKQEAEYVFQLKKLTDETFAIQSVVTGTTAKASTEYNVAIGTDKNDQPYRLSFDKEGDMTYVVFSSTSNNQPGEPALHASGDGAPNYAEAPVVIWKATESAASQWVVEPASVTSTAILTAAKDRLNRAKIKANENLGTEFGQFTHQITQVQQAAETSEDVAAINDAVLSYIAKEGYKLVPPADGMLLQIQPNFHATTTDSRIVGSTQKVSVMVLRTEATELNSIFYFKSGQLICLGTGTSLKASGTQIQTGYYESGDPVEFGTTGSQKYSLKVGALYLKADANNGTGNGAPTNATSTHDEDGWSHFMLHKVTSIPVRIGSTGYATLCLPVAVQVAEGYEAFAAKKKDGADYLELIPLTGVIPAGTAFIVKGAPSTDTKASICQLTVKTEQGSANAENVLKGFTDYSQQSTFTGTVYGLTKNTEGSAVFARLENGISPIPFRAFYTQTGNNAGVNELNLRIDSTLTGVQQLQQLGTPAPFFDLFGRRVQSPQKGGIYLQGGRKVVVQ